MPLFYFRPMDFHADKRKRRPLIETDFDLGVTLIYLVVGLITLFLFVMFVVLPVFQVLGEGGL